MARRIKPPKRRYPYMTLAAANFFLPYAKERGVSKVARGESKSSVTKEGFMQAYARVQGDPKKLVKRMATSKQSWAERRDNFVARHTAQLVVRREKLWETSGKYKGWPTRRHLGLIMWAMTPDPSAVGRFIISHKGSSATAKRVVKPRTNGMSRYRKAVRVSGKAIKVPRDWVDTVMELVKRPVPPETGVATHYVALSLRDSELPALFREARGLAYFTLTLLVYAGTTVPWGSEGETSTGWYNPTTRTMAMAQGEPRVRAAVAHELSHLLQYYGQQLLAEKGNLAAGDAAAPMYGDRRQADASEAYSAEAPIEFEAYVVTAIEDLRETVEGYYDRIETVGPQAPPEMPIHRALTDASVRRETARRLVDTTLASWNHRFPDARTRKHFVKKVSNAAVDILDQAERRFARRKLRLPKRRPKAIAANPRPRANGLSKRRKTVRASGKAIKVPRAWIDTVLNLTDLPVPGTYRDYSANLSLDEPDLPASLREHTAGRALSYPITVRVYPSSRVPHLKGPVHGTWDDSTRTLAVARYDEQLLVTIPHELTHAIQSIGFRVIGPDYGYRKRKGLDIGPVFGDYDEIEPEIASFVESFRRNVERTYRTLRTVSRADDPSFTYVVNAGDRRRLLQYMADTLLGAEVGKFGDARTQKYVTKKFASAASAIIDAAEDANRVDLAYVAGRLAGGSDPMALASRLLEPDPSRLVGNPRYSSAKRDDPELWERVKAKVTRGTKGGKAGQWSARKAQFAVAEYQRLGGGYIGPKSPRNALAKWTREEWGTKSGKASLKTGERYLPKAAREALTPQEYAETTRAKRAGLRRGEQFTAQPGRIARKTAKYRK